MMLTSSPRPEPSHLEFTHGFSFGNTIICPSLITSIKHFSKVSLLSPHSVYTLNDDSLDLVQYFDKYTIEKIVYVSYFRIFVCLLDSGKLHICSEDFVSIYCIDDLLNISCLICNEVTHKMPYIISCGSGNFSIWHFRFGGKKMVTYKSFTHIFTLMDSPTIIQIENLSNRNQRAFVVVENMLFIIRIENGYLLKKLCDLHKSFISSLIYIDSLSLLISGSELGIIKILDDSYCLLHTFVAHIAEICCIHSLNNSNILLTSCLESDFNIWNVETGKLIQQLSISPITQMFITNNPNKTLLVSENFVSFLLFDPIYYILRSLSFPSKNISNDIHLNNIFLTGENSGNFYDVNSMQKVQSLNFEKRLSDLKKLLYVSLNDTFYGLSNFGSFFHCQYSISTNLLEISFTWESKDSDTFSTFNIYTFSDQTFTEDRLHYDSFFIFLGTFSGKILIINSKTKQIQSSIQGHINEVTLIEPQPLSNQIFTCSLDCTIKVWHIFPHLFECLLEVTSFDLTYSPSLFISSKSRLCIALNSSNHGVHSILLIDTRNYLKYTHSEASDHLSCITHLDICETLSIFVSLSKDKSFRFWNWDNMLLTILWIDCIPNSFCFLNSFGHLLFTYGKKICIIYPECYFSKQYINDIQLFPIHDVDFFKHPKLVPDILDDVNNIKIPLLLRKEDISSDSLLFQNELNSEYAGFDLCKDLDAFQFPAIKNNKDQSRKICSNSFSSLHFFNFNLGSDYSQLVNSSIYFPNSILFHRYYIQTNEIPLTIENSLCNLFGETVLGSSSILDDSILEENCSESSAILGNIDEITQCISFEESAGTFERKNLLTLTPTVENKNIVTLTPTVENMNSISSINSKVNVGKVFSSENMNISSPQNDIPNIPLDDTQKSIHLTPQSIKILPKFLSQFCTQPWFKFLNYDLNSERFLKECTPYSFYLDLNSLIFTVNNFTGKTAIVNCLLILQGQFDMSEKIISESVQKILKSLSWILLSQNSVKAEKRYIFVCLTLLHNLKIQDKILYIAQILVEFILGDEEIRGLIQDNLNAYGLKDPFRIFPSFLLSFKTDFLDGILDKYLMVKVVINWLTKLELSSISKLNYKVNIYKGKYIEIINAYLVEKGQNKAEIPENLLIEIRKKSSIANEDFFQFEGNPHLKSVTNLPKVLKTNTVKRFGETNSSHCLFSDKTFSQDFGVFPSLNLKSDQRFLLRLPVHKQDIISQTYKDTELLNLKLNSRKYFLEKFPK